MLQISEYLASALLLAFALVLAISFAAYDHTSGLRKWASPTIYCLISAYLFAVVLTQKGESPWSSVGNKQQFGVSIEVIILSGSYANTPFYTLYSSGISPRTVSPVNVILKIQITNTSRYPVRLESYKALLRDNSRWLSVAKTLIPIPLVTSKLFFRKMNRPAYTSMIPLTTNIDALDGDSGQIEALRQRDFIAAFEIKDNKDPGASYIVELRVTTDVAGSSTGKSKRAKADNDPSLKEIGGLDFTAMPPQDIGPAQFVYYSELASRLK